MSTPLGVDKWTVGDGKRGNLQPIRCPQCGAVKWDGWEITHRHRPPCDFTGTDPSTWVQP